MTEDLTDIDGVGPAIAEQLRGAGFETVDNVKEASIEDLCVVDGITVNHEGLEDAFMSNLRDYHENDD